jgi:hypothetical protein
MVVQTIIGVANELGRPAGRRGIGVAARAGTVFIAPQEGQGSRLPADAFAV